MTHKLHITKEDLKYVKKLAENQKREVNVSKECLLGVVANRQYKGFLRCGLDDITFTTVVFEIDTLGEKLIQLYCESEWDKIAEHLPCTVTFE